MKNTTPLIYQNNKKHFILGYFYGLLPIGGFKMAGFLDLGVSLDVNELFRFIQTALVGTGNLSNMFDGTHRMYLSSHEVYHQEPSIEAVNKYLTHSTSIPANRYLCWPSRYCRSPIVHKSSYPPSAVTLSRKLCAISWVGKHRVTSLFPRFIFLVSKSRKAILLLAPQSHNHIFKVKLPCLWVRIRLNSEKLGKRLSVLGKVWSFWGRIKIQPETEMMILSFTMLSHCTLLILGMLRKFEGIGITWILSSYHGDISIYEHVVSLQCPGNCFRENKHDPHL